MSEMIKRVADAIRDLRQRQFEDEEDWARAAIEAMREPTERMLREGDTRVPEGTVMPSKIMLLTEWRAMIDAALGAGATAKAP